jgi:hypothetical protein
MVRRGDWLIHKRTESTDAIVRWSSRLTRISRAQFKFQARLADTVAIRELIDTSLLAAVKKLVIVISTYDRVVNNTNAPVEALSQAKIVTMPTDHVSVTEVPKEIAKELSLIHI